MSRALSYSSASGAAATGKWGLPEAQKCRMLPCVSIGELPIEVDRQRIAEFCNARGIRRLSLFGSVLRKDFDPKRSDVDVLAEFEPGALRGVGFRYFRYAEELGAILGRRVDFCSRLNKYIEAAVRREALPIYERA
jgi:uncharacterized protein